MVVVVVVVYSSIFLSTDTFIMSIGKHENLNAFVMIELKCKNTGIRHLRNGWCTCIESTKFKRQNKSVIKHASKIEGT